MKQQSKNTSARNRAVIFVNGVIHNDRMALSILQQNDFFIAVNGGYTHMKRLGLQPHILIGDMDSLPSEEKRWLTEMKIDIRKFPEDKDETDLELALDLACELKTFDAIRIVAAVGGRLDQTLANILLLDQHRFYSLDIRLDDGSEEVFFIRSKTIIEGFPGDTISLLPLKEPARQIVTEGLAFPLKAETLWPEKTRGISNKLTGSKAVIDIGEGQLLCIHTRHKIRSTHY